MVECLKKSGRIASQCMEKSVQVQLFVELVNCYMLFYEKGNTTVSTFISLYGHCIPYMGIVFMGHYYGYCIPYSGCIYFIVFLILGMQISPDTLKQLVDKIREDIDTVEEESIKTHFLNTIAHFEKATQGK